MGGKNMVSRLMGAGWLAVWLLICAAVLLAEWAVPAQAEALSRVKGSDDDIRRQVIQQSIANYPGPCACPYNVMRNGRRCGRVSAYVKPGSHAPKCYPEDVSAAEVAAYRARQS